MHAVSWASRLRTDCRDRGSESPVWNFTSVRAGHRILLTSQALGLPPPVPCLPRRLPRSGALNRMSYFPCSRRPGRVRPWIRRGGGRPRKRGKPPVLPPTSNAANATTTRVSSVRTGGLRGQTSPSRGAVGMPPALFRSSGPSSGARPFSTVGRAIAPSPSPRHVPSPGNRPSAPARASTTHRAEGCCCGPDCSRGRRGA